MKFEQAMRAMRRGEKVRRKGWAGPLYMSLASQTMMINEADLFLNDWVIRRKKTKAPPLRDVFKEPRVGDVIGRKKTDEPGYFMTWAVVHVTPKSVRFVGSCGDVGEQSRDDWESSNSYTVIYRAEG